MKLSCLTCALLLVTAGIPTSSAAVGGEAPLVDAGLDQSVVGGTTVYLDGGGTVDPDGEIVDYSWSIETPRGETTTPTDPNTVMTRFVPEQTGRYHVELTVTDDDGNSRSDTLYVDVGGSVDSRTGSPDTTANESAAERVDRTPSQVTAEPTTTLLSQGAQNEPPFGRILGPESVRSGSTVRYVLEVGDADGEVMDFRWLPVSHTDGSSGVIDARSVDQTYSFDVEPGTEVQLPAVVVDDDGESSTVTKTVLVTNNPPEAMIHGNSTVAVGTVHEYEVIASDPDGSVTSFAWGTDSDAVEPVETGGMLVGGTSSAGSQTQLYRFTAIPEDDATVSLRATVGDEHGGATTAEKGVTVVESKGKVDLIQPVQSTTPEVLQYEATQSDTSVQLFGSQKATPGRIVFTAVATDNDSEQLTFEWEFGDLGTAETVESGGTMRSEVSFPFGTDEVNYLNGVPVTVTVTDQNGNSRSVTKTLDFEERPGQRQVEETLFVERVDERTIRGRLELHTTSGSESPRMSLRVFFGDGTSTEISAVDQSDERTYRYRFNHQYRSSGEYVVHAQRDDSISRKTVDVGNRTYVEWQYEQKITEDTRTVAAERPAGSGWERLGVDHVEYEQTGVETTRTQIVDGTAINPDDSWERVGTDVEYHMEKRTTQATESPGEDWQLTERNVDQRVVSDGWETRTVPSKWMADSGWEYVGKVARTTTTTETTESATRPDGSDWERGAKTGDSVVSGYSTEWVTNRYFVDDDWQYVTSERYVSGYTESTQCVEYANFRGGSYCIEERTSRSPTYDTRYKYRVPEYADEYEWQRTVEGTTYDYEYQVETYSTEAVHEYTTEERVVTKYAQWERPVYNETTLYRWTKTETSWEETTSLSEPTGDVRNVEKRVRDCGDEWDEGEPESCREDQP